MEYKLFIVLTAVVASVCLVSGAPTDGYSAINHELKQIINTSAKMAYLKWESKDRRFFVQRYFNGRGFKVFIDLANATSLKIPTDPSEFENDILAVVGLYVDSRWHHALEKHLRRALSDANLREWIDIAVIYGDENVGRFANFMFVFDHSTNVFYAFVVNIRGTFKFDSELAIQMSQTVNSNFHPYYTFVKKDRDNIEPFLTFFKLVSFRAYGSKNPISAIITSS